MRNGLRQIGTILLMAGLAAGVAADLTACPYQKCLSISIGQSTTNELTLLNEIHGYSLDAAAGDILLIRINTVTGVWDPSITLLHPRGYVIRDDGEPGTRRAEILTPKLPTSDSYDLLVEDFYGLGRGTYNLTVQATNRPVDAQTIQYDTFRRDSLTVESQMKPYRFQAEANDFVSIEMIRVAGDLEPHVRLFAPDGRLIADDSDNEFALLSNVRLYDSGYYTIFAADVTGNDIGEYFLVVLKPSTDADDDDGNLPAGFSLEQNHPNPFNPETSIDFALPRRSFVTVDIYNVGGGLVRSLLSRDMAAGEHRVTWDGRDNSGGEASSGVYFYRLRADDVSASKKMLLLR